MAAHTGSLPCCLLSWRANGGAPVKLTNHERSWIVSMIGVMAIFGNSISPVLMTRFGRQKAHLISTIPALLGWIVFFLGNSVPLFLFGRILHGLALGLRTPLAAILVAEYTDPKYRGAFLGTFGISLSLGILLTHICGAQLTYKMTAVVCSILPLIAMAIISLSPESPSWLVSKGKFEEAEKAFRWLRGEGRVQNEELEAMINAQKEELSIGKRRESVKITRKGVFQRTIDPIKNVLKIFKKKEVYKPAIIAISMLIVFEFGGAHMFAAYGNIILQAVLNKDDAKDVAWQFAVMDILRTICAFMAIFILKYFKRRKILVTSGVMTVLSLASISIFIYLREAEIFSSSWFLNITPMSLMIVYTVSFCLGLVPLNWVICGEVFPLAYRSLGSTLSTSFLAPSYVLSMKTAPHLFSSIGVQGAFLLYSLLLIVLLTVIYVLLPETKDRTLQDIDDSFKVKTTNPTPDVEMSLSNKEYILLVKQAT